jgi:hypothetical protein
MQARKACSSVAAPYWARHSAGVPIKRIGRRAGWPAGRTAFHIGQRVRGQEQRAAGARRLRCWRSRARARVKAAHGLVQHIQGLRASRQAARPSFWVMPLEYCAPSVERGRCQIQRCQHGVHLFRMVGQTLQAQHIAQEFGAGQVVGRDEAFRQEAARCARPAGGAAGRRSRCWPPSGAQKSSRHLIRLVLPAPLTPTSADIRRRELQVHAAQHAGRAIAFVNLLDAGRERHVWVAGCLGRETSVTVAHPSRNAISCDSGALKTLKARFLP